MALKLRPHHLIDIVTSFGHGKDFPPHPHGHALHTVAAEVLANPDIEVEFIIGADDICRPCSHLTKDGRCDDILTKFDPPVGKQDYNDAMDRRILDYLKLPPGTRMTAAAFLRIVAGFLPGIVTVLTADAAIAKSRLAGLRRGLAILGLSDDDSG